MLKNILAIAGQPGLYKMISSTKNGIIVENIEDKKRMPAYGTSKISTLEDIAIYSTQGEDKPLAEVFKSIRDKENGGPCVSHKSENATLEKYFATIMPEYDVDRVYISDIKKVLQWYNTLQKNNMLDTLDESPAEETEKAE
jgi:hypothetical protein